jgi:hypothetical protein
VIGKIKIKVHRKIQGETKTATTMRDIDQWSVAICIEEKQLIPISDKSVRVGLGITSAIALNNEDLIECPCFPRKTEERFCRERRMALKKGKSKVISCKVTEKGEKAEHSRAE